MEEKASLAITVLNEETTITPLLQSILSQTRLPDDVVIVDGGSSDKTVSIIKRFKGLETRLHLVTKARMSRPTGRNISIETAKHDIVAITDAGCLLDAEWFSRIIAPFADPTVEVVSGFYRAKATSVFEQCLIPYVLVMPDKVKPSSFLPSTRSMALRKWAWKEAGGFPENFTLNEDYVFAKRLKNMGKRFYFVKNAIVYWLPRKNFAEAFRMFYTFAKGDSQARIFRPKVIFIYVRYLLGLFLLIFGIKNPYVFLFITFGFIAYLLWSIAKNYAYVRDWQALFYLPALQIVSDFAVITGSIAGLVRSRYGLF